MKSHKHSLPCRITSCFITIVFTLTVLIPPNQGYAQGVLNLPAPGTMVPLSASFDPITIKGVNINIGDPLKFNFIVDKGDSGLKDEALQEESMKLIKYFLASLTVPEQEMWVNLSPYEKDRIVPEQFGKTLMGRDLLAQDYMLKQLTASLMHPEDELGGDFWKRVYQKAYAKYGTTEIPMNTFNKIWIVPDKAVIYEHEKGAFIVESKLRVLLEEDYLALEANQNNAKHGLGNMTKDDIQVISGVSSEVIREILIPEIEKEVNEGKIFANLRQIYNSMILASWYKQNLKESLLGQIYVNKQKIDGVDIEDANINQKIYTQYVEAFKKGVFDFIKEDYDAEKRSIIPRKYFSGGVGLDFQTADRSLATARGDDVLREARSVEDGVDIEVDLRRFSRRNRSVIPPGSPAGVLNLLNEKGSMTKNAIAIELGKIRTDKEGQEPLSLDTVRRDFSALGYWKLIIVEGQGAEAVVRLTDAAKNRIDKIISVIEPWQRKHGVRPNVEFRDEITSQIQTILEEGERRIALGKRHNELMRSLDSERNDLEKRKKITRNSPESVIVGANVIQPYVQDLIKSGKRFLVVTSRKAQQQMRDWGFPNVDEFLSKSINVDIVHYKFLDKDPDNENLFNRAKELESSPEIIIGIGMGSVTDWAKALGHKFGVDVDIIPSAVSTDAMVTEKIVIRDQDEDGENYDVYGYYVGAPRKVVVDIDFVRLNKRGNIAGAGDHLCSLIGLQDWKFAVERGMEKENQGIYAKVRKLLTELEENKDKIAQNTDEGIKFVMDFNKRISLLRAEFGSGRPRTGSEHLLSYAIESAIKGRKQLLHGEVIPITVVLMAYIYNKNYSGTFDLNHLLKLIRDLGLPTNLNVIGLTKEELIYGLQNAKPDEKRMSIIDVHNVSREEAQEAVDALFTAEGNLVASSPFEGDRAQLDSEEFEKGGIDFNPEMLNMSVKKNRAGIRFPVPQEPIKNYDVDGFLPVIINITPITDFPLILGLVHKEKQLTSLNN